MSTDGNVKSAQRVFEILECFQRTKTPLRLRDVVAELNYAPSSVTALLKTMTERRYLTFNRTTRTYFPTTRLAQLVNWMPTVAFEQGPVLAAMENLRRNTREMVVLGVATDIHVEYVEALRSPQAIQLWTPPGSRWSMIQMGMGWLFLNRMPRATAIRIYERTAELGRIDPKEFSCKHLLARVAKIEKDEILFTSQSDFVQPLVHPGGSMVSMMIPTPFDHRPLGIGVGGPYERVRENLNSIKHELCKERARIASASFPG